MPIVKKYANRKLHLVGSVKYLSMLDLSDLAAKMMVYGGESGDLQVICDRTGRDVTLETLSRALYERLKRYCGEGCPGKLVPFSAKKLMSLIALVPGSAQEEPSSPARRAPPQERRGS